ncbi:HAD hydrolase family protein [Klebsiella pneumoniae subsp. pneumoniae]|nr:HAD hydrolase family protein [Klebsiella pneumoniae subsp. pneumoniae]
MDDAMLYRTPHRACGSHPQLGAGALPEDQRPVFAQVDSLAQAAVREVNAVWKFALTDDDITPACSGLRSRLARRAGPRVRNGRGTTGRWISRAPATAKAKRLAQMGGRPGLSMQDVVAFGDNYNDLSMLEAAGAWVAMGNAVDEVSPGGQHSHRRQ